MHRLPQEVLAVYDQRWGDYIANAELAWFRVFDAGKVTKKTMPDGAPLTVMPPRFNTRQKIYAYFRRWWGPRLACNMLNNLPLIEHGGKLYMIAYDFPPVSMTARSVHVTQADGNVIRLHATLYGGFPEEQIEYQVTYNQLPRRPMISRRSDAELDFRYQSCPRAEE